MPERHFDYASDQVEGEEPEKNLLKTHSNNNAKSSDFLIVGGGIIGIATALEIQRRNTSAKIIVLEKEASPAVHQSSRNSGVIHAGVYYKPGSLKAKFCREGVKATQDFCREHHIPVKPLGKLIVATSEAEVVRMRQLGERGRQNNIVLEDVDEVGLRQMEPHINGLAALYSPTTGITDYGKITQVMADIFFSRGGKIHYDEQVCSGSETLTHMAIHTNRGTIHAERVITCAGLHSDRVIRSLGQEPHYRVIPFRGDFFRIENQPDDLVNHLIYPVPDPERPFLGVHLTRKINGGFTVGPNAALAFKREGYHLSDFSLADIADTFSYLGFWRMLAQNANSAVTELISSASKRIYLKRIHQYCSRIKLADLKPYPSGVRAQAVASDGKIIDDFLFVKTKRCLHVGNAPSPAATSAIPIAKYIVGEIN